QGRVVRAVVGLVAEQERERDQRGDEGDQDRGRREIPGAAARQPRAPDRDRQGGDQRREEADPGGDDQPRSVLSRSTSRSSLRRAIATIRPRPTTTSEAATAITASAKICPSPFPWYRENAIRARFDPLSMISRESRTISGLRRMSTPSAPVQNRKPETQRYQTTSGPIIAR